MPHATPDAAEEPEEPEDHLQIIHEMIAAMVPEICTPKFKAGKSAAMAAILAVHDHCVFHGASCEGMREEEDR